MSEGIKLTPDAVSVSKLSKPPLKVDFGIYEMNPDYVETDDEVENQNNVYRKVSEAEAYLHPLTWMERDLIKASMVKVYQFWQANDGEDKQIARMMVEEAMKRLLVFFALKNTEDPKSERIFASQQDVVDYYHTQTIFDLNDKYYAEFGMSDKEWGNYLRARSSKISSVLPATSQEPESSTENYQS